MFISFTRLFLVYFIGIILVIVAGFLAGMLIERKLSTIVMFQLLVAGLYAILIKIILQLVGVTV